LTSRRKIAKSLYRRLLVECRGVCCLCHEHPIQEIHHIVALHLGGGDDPENLAPVCASCHTLVDTGRYSPEKLRSERDKWTLECQRILFSIISSSPAGRLRSELGSFLRLEKEVELAEFSNRLTNFAKAGSLFSNFVNIRVHDIKRTVDESGSCWTWEEQGFMPFSSLTKRRVQFNGSSPVDFATTQFESSIVLDEKEVTPEWKCVVDAPQAKVIELNLPRTLNADEVCILRFRYFWPTTWNMTESAYTYDVLAWIERVKYSFSLPDNVKIRSVQASQIDVFGHTWRGAGKTTVNDSSFEWSDARLPLFTSCKVKYYAAPR